MEIKWNKKLYKLKALYIPELEINLLFVKLFYKEFKAKRAFNNKKMYFYKNRKILLSVNNFYNIYIITNIIKNDFDIVFPVEEIEEEVPAELKNIVYNKGKVNRVKIQKWNRLN